MTLYLRNIHLRDWHRKATLKHTDMTDIGSVWIPSVRRTDWMSYGAMVKLHGRCGK